LRSLQSFLFPNKSPIQYNSFDISHYLSPYISLIFSICCLFFCSCAEKNLEKNLNLSVSNETINRDRLYLVSRYGVFQNKEADDFLVSLCVRISTTISTASSNPKRFVLRSTILDTETPLALSIGSGEIFLSRGILKLLKSEGEVAFVISHEFGHDILNHHVNGPDTETAELEADLFALSVITNAGFPAMSSISSLIGTYGSEKFLEDGAVISFIAQDELTHPSLRMRLKVLRESIAIRTTFTEDKTPTFQSRRFLSFKKTF